jgi:hypothetical protein
MSFEARTFVITGGVAAFVAGCLAAPQFFPQAFASEPQSHLLDRGKDIFPIPFDTKRLRKYEITFDDSVSTEVVRTQTVKKYGFGQKTIVSIVTTPTGVYSSDGLASPNVRYPGIEVTPKHRHRHWAFSTSTSTYGTSTWSSFSSGSFTYYTYSFKPAARSRT